MLLPSIHIEYPPWVSEMIDWEKRYDTAEEKMRLAIDVALRNVLEGTGGPFGAAVFEEGSGAVLAVGMNMVVPMNNAMLHAEIVAFMMAQQRLGSFTLDAEGERREIVTSCEPCAMCLGAVLWSGARKLTIGAAREDAIAHGFEEGPVFPESYAYLEERGIEVVRDVLRDSARGVLDLYVERNGLIYNAGAGRGE
jgi:tRNA(Arg) A34 adenosine deaminase TadA